MVAVDLERIEQRLDTRIDAVIGLDFLARRNFRLDYRHKKLVFTSNTDADGAGAIAFEMRHEAGGAYILLPLRSDGQNLQVLLDTGTKDLTLFDRRLGGILQRLRVLDMDSNVTAAGRPHCGGRNERHQCGTHLPQKAKSVCHDQLRGRPTTL